MGNTSLSPAVKTQQLESRNSWQCFSEIFLTFSLINNFLYFRLIIQAILDEMVIVPAFAIIIAIIFI